MYQTTSNVFLGALIVLFVLWALAGAIPAAWMAGQKGRSQVSWFLMGVFYGPFAVIMCGLTPVKTRGTGYVCPACVEPVHPTASRCPHCREGLVPVDPTVTLPGTWGFAHK
jgi:hypothetical protein